MKVEFYLMAFLLVAGSVFSTRASDDGIHPSDIVIEGEIVDSLLSLQPERKVPVVLYVSAIAANMTLSPVEEYRQSCSYKERFRFVLPASSERVYVNIQFGTLDPLRDWSDYTNIYIFEPGDRIHCTLSNSFYTFRGKGAGKLKCQSELFKCRYRPTKEDNRFINAGQWDKALVLTTLKQDSVLRLRTRIVKRYAPVLGKELTDIMLVNCYGMRYYSWLWTEMFGLPEPGRYQTLMNSTAYKSIGNGLDGKFSPAVLVASPYYCDFLLQKIALDNVRFAEGKAQSIKSPEHIARMFSTIRTQYHGPLRDKLLTEFIIMYQQRPSILDYVDGILSVIRNPQYKEILLDIKNTRSKGLDFYPFAFENEKGDTLRLDDFKGKVVLLDFWYTGCENCIQLNKAMQPIVDHYENNPALKFVSVSIDKSKTGWLRSIAGGLYTHPESVNLYTGGQGQNHPLFKKYGIVSYPTLFVLRDGKIFSSTPPRPQFDMEEQKPVLKGGTEELIRLLDEALKGI